MDDLGGKFNLKAGVILNGEKNKQNGESDLEYKLKT